MKSIRIAWVLIILVLIFGCQKKQEAEKMAEQKAAESEAQPAVSIAEVSGFSYVCLPAVGSYGKHDQVIAEFMQVVDSQQVEISGPMFGIYYNSPTDTPEDSLIWEIGFEVPAATEVTEPLVVKKWEFTTIAKAVHTGPFETVEQSYQKIFKFIGEQNRMPAGPVMERFLSDPQKVKPEELKTEIWVPVSSVPTEK